MSAGDAPDTADIIRARGRYEIAKRMATGLLILCTALPIYTMTSVARALAGKHTTIAFTFTVSIVFSVAISAGLLKLWQKTARQGKELKSQRVRMSRLEREKNELRVEKQALEQRIVDLQSGAQ